MTMIVGSEWTALRVCAARLDPSVPASEFVQLVDLLVMQAWREGRDERVRTLEPAPESLGGRSAEVGE